MPTKSCAVPPQRDRDMHSRSDCDWQSQNAPLPAGRFDISVFAEDQDYKALRALAAAEYGASMPTALTKHFAATERKGCLGGEQRLTNHGQTDELRA